MLYEFWENFKIKVYNFLNPAQPFVPAGTTPIVEPPAPKSSFSFTSLKPTNLKELSFETKRLLVLGATFLTALLVLSYLKANYATYSASRTTVQSQPVQSAQPTAFSAPPIDD